MKVSYEKIFCRNIGIITKREQGKLRNTKIAIAGLGAEGSMLAYSLARIGIGNFNLADPEIFETSNLNRQMCFIDTLGENKAKTVGEIIKQINPFANVKIFPEGVNEKNVDNFLLGTDILVDAIDIEKPDISILLNMKARERGLFTFCGVSVGFGAYLFVFDPHGVLMADFLDKYPLGWVPKLPSYVDEKIFESVVKGLIPAPVIICGVLAMAAMVTAEIVCCLLNRSTPVFVPQFKYIDFLDFKLQTGHLEV